MAREVYLNKEKGQESLFGERFEQLDCVMTRLSVKRSTWRVPGRNTIGHQRLPTHFLLPFLHKSKA